MNQVSGLMSSPKKFSVALVDDHELMLLGIINFLGPEFEVVGTFSDGRAAVEGYKTLRPDIFIMDISLPLLNGIEAARQITQFDSKALLLFVTMQSDKDLIEAAFRAGAAGYVLKQSAAADLLQAMRTVLDHRYYVSPVIQATLAEWPPVGGSHPADVFQSNLTPRQMQVLHLIAEGRAMKEIANILNISVRTVEFHKNSISETLGLRSTAELTKYAIEHKIAGTDNRTSA